MVWCGSKDRYLQATYLKDFELHAILIDNHSRINNHHYWGGPIRSFNVHENFYFDNELDTHMSSIFLF